MTRLPVQIPPGMKFGRLTVLDEAEPVQGYGRNYRRLRCRCQCGNEVTVMLANLRAGRTRSCGCLQRDRAGGRDLEQARVCECGRPAVIKGKCRRCYLRQWREIRKDKVKGEAMSKELTEAQRKRARRLFDRAAGAVNGSLGKRVKAAGKVQEVEAEQRAWYSQTTYDGELEVTVQVSAVRHDH